MRRNPAASSSCALHASRWAAPALMAVIALAGVCLLAGPASTAPQQAPNSRVVLDLPEGYSPSPLYSGFQNEDLGVSYVILEAPLQSYAELATGLTPEKLAKRGIAGAERFPLARRGDYIYMRARQSSPAGDYAKFFVLFKTADQTVLVSVNVPKAALEGGSVKVEEIEHVLATATTTAYPAVHDVYQLGYLGPFKEAGTIVGTSKLYTLDGKMEPERKGETRSVFLVAPSLDKRPVVDDSRFAEKLLASLPGFEEFKIEASRPVKVGPLSGFATEAQAVETAEGKPMRLYQVVLLPDDGGYFRLLGMATLEEAERLWPEFRKIAESFRLAD